MFSLGEDHMLLERFLKRCISNYEQVEDPNVRKAYGTCSSVVGICCNILLFVLKYVMGTLSHSIAIVSDAFNNLSDCASCLITLFGYKLAAKPADKGHPFGHGRMEYLTSLVIAVMIALMGFELLRNSVEKIIRPDAVQFRWLTLAVLVLSIGVKLWMAWFNTKLGKRIQSTVMIATAKDSRSDVAATGATIGDNAAGGRYYGYGSFSVHSENGFRHHSGYGRRSSGKAGRCGNGAEAERTGAGT